MNGHLDAGLGACALEDDIKAVGHVKVGESGGDRFFRAPKLVFCGFGFVGHGETVGGLRKPLLAGKVETGLVDVYRDDAGRAVRLGEGACEEPDGAYAEDEDGGGGGGGKAGAAGGVYEDGERLGKCRLVECTVVR